MFTDQYSSDFLAKAKRMTSSCVCVAGYQQQYSVNLYPGKIRE
jgi:hypothetical protein